MAEAAGFVLVAVLLQAWLGRRIALTALLPVAVALPLTLLIVPGVWGGTRGLGGVRDGLVLAPGITEREKCLLDGGHAEEIGLSRFLVQRVPPGGRLAIEGSVAQVCLQLTILPRVVTGPGEAHEYTLYTGDDIPAGARGLPNAETYGRDAVLVKEG